MGAKQSKYGKRSSRKEVPPGESVPSTKAPTEEGKDKVRAQRAETNATSSAIHDAGDANTTPANVPAEPQPQCNHLPIPRGYDH